jgi:hypothetical protein
MRHTIFTLLGAIALMGCGSTGTGGGDTDDEDVIAPEFPSDVGQEPAAVSSYPPGPYGIGKGSIVANYKFMGFPNAMKDSTVMKELQLAEFYNPTGDGLYEEGSLMEVGTPKPKALLIDIASVWCGPCNYEADVILPVEYAKYKPLGGEFFLTLADGSSQGKPATSKSLLNWTSKYDVDYPSSIDPSYKLEVLFKEPAYPQNMIIDTRTMKIVHVIPGAPDEAFWAIFDKVLAGTI